MSITAVAPWGGSNRTLAPHVGKSLKGCNFVGVVFAGGMSEVFSMDARTINVNDKHRLVINMARVMADELLGPKFYRAAKRALFHPDELAWAQTRCARVMQPGIIADCFPDVRECNMELALAYFTAAWMTRHGSAGTKGEFTADISTRWIASGGDSNAHYRGAVKAIQTLRRTLQRCNFTCLDWREFVEQCRQRDRKGHGLYVDAPFFEAGRMYAHNFGSGEDEIREHRELAAALLEFKETRVVCRWYDVPLIRELYPSTDWQWNFLEGRKQTNEKAHEVLLVRNI